MSIYLFAMARTSSRVVAVSLGATSRPISASFRANSLRSSVAIILGIGVPEIVILCWEGKMDPMGGGLRIRRGKNGDGSFGWIESPNPKLLV